MKAGGWVKKNVWKMNKNVLKEKEGRKEDKEGIMGDTGKKYSLAEYGTELEGMKWKVEGNSEGDRSVETEICARSLHGRGRELTS